VLESGTCDFPSVKAAHDSPLAQKLFQISGVTGVFFGSDFISINISDSSNWLEVKPHVFGILMDFYASGDPILRPRSAEPASSSPATEEDGVVAHIKELLETRIRPTVQEDGGDVRFHSFVNGIVHLEMQGSCSGCPSSSATLKSGIQNMLMHYIPEVQGVEDWVDKELEQISKDQLAKLEQQIDQTQSNSASPSPSPSPPSKTPS